MPQVVFEHSANLKDIDYQNFFADIYSVIKKIFKSATCKIRAIPYENYYIGAENGENAFAYLSVAMKPGEERTEQFRKDLADNLIPIVKKYLDPIKQSEKVRFIPTVEIRLVSEQYYFLE